MKVGDLVRPISPESTAWDEEVRERWKSHPNDVYQIREIGVVTLSVDGKRGEYIPIISDMLFYDNWWELVEEVQDTIYNSDGLHDMLESL